MEASALLLLYCCQVKRCGQHVKEEEKEKPCTVLSLEAFTSCPLCRLSTLDFHEENPNMTDQRMPLTHIFLMENENIRCRYSFLK